MEQHRSESAAINAGRWALHVPSRVLECGFCRAVVQEFGERREDFEGAPHTCRGYLDGSLRQERVTATAKPA